MARRLKPAPRRRELLPHAVVNWLDDPEAFDIYDWEVFQYVYSLTTKGKLIDRFYEFNNTGDGMSGWIKLCLNPKPITPPRVNRWLVIHFGDFYSYVEQNPHTGAGPHSVRLYYRSRSNRIYWLASCQIERAFFFREEEIVQHLFRILHRREFFQTDKEKEKVIAI